LGAFLIFVGAMFFFSSALTVFLFLFGQSNIYDLLVGIFLLVPGILIFRYGSKLNNRKKESQVFDKYTYLIYHERIMSIPLLAKYLKTTEEQSISAVERMIEKGLLPEAYIDYDNRTIMVPAVIEQLKMEKEYKENSDNNTVPTVNASKQENVKKDYGIKDTMDNSDLKKTITKDSGTITIFGGTYKGELKNGKPNGLGSFYMSNGTKYIGNWENGKPCGSGVMLYSNGDKYEGDFLDGKRNGNGTYTRSDGKKLSGNWINGKLVDS